MCPNAKALIGIFRSPVRDLVLWVGIGRIGVLRWPRKADLAAADHYLELVGMEPYADRQISQLSGGQQQRVLLLGIVARSLISILWTSLCRY